MAKEYIPKNDLEQALIKEAAHLLRYYKRYMSVSDVVEELIGVVRRFPAADVIEKKHGYWIKRIVENEKEDYPIRNVDYICSQCEGCWYEPLKYCPMCLAEMDKEEPDELDKHEG